MDNKRTISISGDFSNEEIHNDLAYINQGEREQRKVSIPKHQIMPHPGFEIVKLPNGKLAKLAYKKIYPIDEHDLDIELLHISRFERLRQHRNPATRKEAKKSLKFHYKKAISIIAPNVAAGWNRWSEYILELFVQEKMHKVLWGSGNCGKSMVMAALLYTKWRVKPHKRMVVVATRIVKEAEARVFGYIKGIHAAAPASRYHHFKLIDNSDKKAVYCLLFDKKENKLIEDDRACIISLPIKVKAKNEEIGSNLLGKHPEDALVLCFDECQELSANLLKDRIFANWLTNENLEVFAWGNPVAVDLDMPLEHDMLFSLGSRGLAPTTIKAKCKAENAQRCGTWGWHDTAVLHLTMIDSPKDDPDEVDYRIVGEDGSRIHRLHFLAGKSNVEKIASVNSKNSATWYSQVLGMPFLVQNSNKQQGVLTSFIAREAAMYPLIWSQKNPRGEFFLGVDPSGSGKNDAASIVGVKFGEMQDGRHGVDVLRGDACRTITRTDGIDFTDATVEAMWEISQEYKIPLRNIAIETHAVGEVLRYALQRHIEDGKWATDVARGESFVIINPTSKPTDRPLFKLLGHPRPAEEIVTNIVTEYWVAIRCLFLTRQIFNVPDYILQQLYNRLLESVGPGMKYRIETKESMRARKADSPNDADALANAVELIRQRGFRYRYVPTGHYKEFYGQEYKEKLKRMSADQALNIVGNLLQLGENFGQPENKRKKANAIDCI